MRCIATSLCLLTVLAAGAAHAGPVTFYDGGTMSFSFQEFPLGAQGAFQSEGSVRDPQQFPAGGAGATTALCVEENGKTYVMIAGGVRNADGTVDAAFVFLQGPAPFAAGTYSVDPVDYAAFFGFVDDAAAFTLPEDLPNLDAGAWLDGLPAKDTSVSFAGVVSVNSFQPATLQGMFAVSTTATSGASRLIPDGIFTLDLTARVAPESWGSVKAAYDD